MFKKHDVESCDLAGGGLGHSRDWGSVLCLIYTHRYLKRKMQLLVFMYSNVFICRCCVVNLTHTHSHVWCDVLSWPGGVGQLALKSTNCFSHPYGFVFISFAYSCVPFTLWRHARVPAGVYFIFVLFFLWIFPDRYKPECGLLRVNNYNNVLIHAASRHISKCVQIKFKKCSKTCVCVCVWRSHCLTSHAISV